MRYKSKFRFVILFLGAMAALPTFGTTQAKAQIDPLLGQLMLFGGNFCPRAWAEANGQLLPISQNSALFSILGTQFGGDGRTTFALPNLQARSPVGATGVTPFRIGNQGGSATAQLTVNNLPSHNHLVNATNATGNKFGPGGDYLAAGNPVDGHQAYHDGPPNRTMDPGVISHTGGGQPFDVRSPYIAMTWCIALQGVFPSRN